MYTISEQGRKIYELSPFPIAMYQYKNEKIKTLLVSDGLCSLMNQDRENLIKQLDSNMFKIIHPDDLGRVLKILETFAKKENEYNVVYRIKTNGSKDYHLIHAIGKWQIMPDKNEIATVIYTDITNSSDIISQLSDKYMEIQKDHFYTDPVTELANYNYLNEFGDETANKIRQEGKIPVIIYFDIKGMKSFNTCYGYETGNKLMHKIGFYLNEIFTDSLVIRGSDDHFIVLTEKKDCTKKIEHVNHVIQTDESNNCAGVNAGICEMHEQLSVTTALDFARQARREIGTDLNKTYEYYTIETDEKYWEQQYVIDTFEKALEEKWIKVFYQRIVSTSTGKTCFAEALSRWIDPNRGLLPPDSFIPTLEKYHLMHKLDLYMLDRVCEQLQIRTDINLGAIPVSVNFSAQDFDHVSVVEEIKRIADSHNVSHDKIIIEITEQDAALGRFTFKEQLKELQKDGFKIWLDDFGSGYSSLNVFSSFHFDLIKMDMELLRRLEDNDGANKYIMKAIVGLAKKMNMLTLAEGIETEEHFNFLKEIECDCAQGFHFFKPESLETLVFKIKKQGKNSL